MKEPEKYAEELIRNIMSLIPTTDGTEVQILRATRLAILDVQNTIDEYKITYIAEATNLESKSILKGIFDRRHYFEQVRQILEIKLT